MEGGRVGGNNFNEVFKKNTRGAKTGHKDTTHLGVPSIKFWSIEIF